MSFVLKSIFKKVVDQAHREGFVVDTISDLGIPDILQSDSKYAPTDSFFKLYEIIDGHLEPGFFIRVGQLIQLDDYDVLGLAWKTCLSPRDMCIRCERFFILMTDTQLYKVQDSGETGSITTTKETVAGSPFKPASLNKVLSTVPLNGGRENLLLNIKKAQNPTFLA